MSGPLPTKKRRIEGAGPQSAISALAARRRLAEVNASDAEEAVSSASTNPFSPLQTLHSATKPSHQNSREQALANNTSVAADASGVTTHPPPTSYSSFALTKDNHRVNADGTLEIFLTDCERFLVVGSYGVRVLKGSVAIAGAVLNPSSTFHWVHAPHCYALPVLRTAEDTRLELHHDPNAYDLRKLGRLSPLFRRIWDYAPTANATQSPPSQPTFEFIGNSGESGARVTLQELVSPPEWNRKIASLAESISKDKSAAVLVCGPKSSGKSTFSRLVTNRLLTCVNGSGEGGERLAHGLAVLDLDPGQPEYSPPGTLSLVHVTKPNLGVPFTHPSLDDEAYKVVRCHALATTNPASAAELHAECAMDLYDYYRQTLRNCPLMINTPGWILGLGLELLLEVIQRVRPVEVVYMSTEGPAETVDALRNAIKRPLTTLPSQPSQIKSRTAAHLRNMQTMSYFHSMKHHGTGGAVRLTWSPSALSSMRPVVVRYAGSHSGILGILCYVYQLPADLIAEAINGMVLAIVEIEDSRAFRSLTQTDTNTFDKYGDAAQVPRVLTSSEGLPLIANPNDETLHPRYSRALGLGLVRGVDRSKKCLHMLTPVSLPRLVGGKEIVLIHGSLDAPTWCYTEHLYDQDELKGEDGMEGMGGGMDVDTGGDGMGGVTGDHGGEQDDMELVSADAETAVPWVEVLRGHEKRPVGSKVWRVRRDLGR